MLVSGALCLAGLLNIFLCQRRVAYRRQNKAVLKRIVPAVIGLSDVVILGMSRHQLLPASALAKSAAAQMCERLRLAIKFFTQALVRPHHAAFPAFWRNVVTSVPISDET